MRESIQMLVKNYDFYRKMHEFRMKSPYGIRCQIEAPLLIDIPRNLKIGDNLKDELAQISDGIERNALDFNTAILISSLQPSFNSQGFIEVGELLENLPSELRHTRSERVPMILVKLSEIHLVYIERGLPVKFREDHVLRAGAVWDCAKVTDLISADSYRIG